LKKKKNSGQVITPVQTFIDYYILHLSDPHFREDPSIGHGSSLGPDPITWATFGQLLLRLDQQVKLDAFVVTGDVANSGGIGDLRHARSELAELCQPLNTPPKLFVVPGNYDRFENASSTRRASRNFETEFLNHWGNDRSINHIRLRKAGTSLAIVGADFSPEENSPLHPSEGEATDRIVSRLRHRTKSLQKKAAVVWAFHFAPHFPGLPPKLRLRNEDLVSTLARELEIPDILCGHVHSRGTWHRGVTSYRAAGTICPSVQGNHTQFQILKVRVRQQGNRTEIVAGTDQIDFVWDGNETRFVPEPPQPRSWH